MSPNFWSEIRPKKDEKKSLHLFIIFQLHFPIQSKKAKKKKKRQEVKKLKREKKKEKKEEKRQKKLALKAERAAASVSNAVSDETSQTYLTTWQSEEAKEHGPGMCTPAYYTLEIHK